MQQQVQELEHRVTFLETELEKQTAFNKQIMKQMRKIEYALLQQKKLQQAQMVQPLAQSSGGSG